MKKRSKSYDSLLKNIDDLLAPCLAYDWPNLPVDRTDGCYVFGRDGRRYLDFLAGFGVCNVGHNHPRVVAAARDRIDEGMKIFSEAVMEAQKKT